jgi:hypothetical protein
MQFNPLSRIDLIGRSNILTNRIIVKALQSNRGYKIRGMNESDLKKMVESIFNAVYNQLAVEAQLAYDFNFDKYVLERDGIASDLTAEFKPRSDVEIEKEVTAYFEINGKLQYREVSRENISVELGW